MGPNIFALLIIAATVGFGFVIIAQQANATDSNEQDPSSTLQ